MSQGIRKFQYLGQDGLSLPAERQAFNTLKEWLSDIAGELALSDKIRRQLLIAADEIFTNIASYGYPSSDGIARVEVEFNFTSRILTLAFFDNGVAYNPLVNATPDVSKPLDERHVGGLGIFMVKKLMDSVEYRRDEGQNILRMTKKIVKE